MRIWLYLFSLAYFLAHYPNIRHYDVSGLWPLSKQPYNEFLECVKRLVLSLQWDYFGIAREIVDERHIIVISLT